MVGNDNDLVHDGYAQHTHPSQTNSQLVGQKSFSSCIYPFHYFFHSLLTVQLLIANLPLVQ